MLSNYILIALSIAVASAAPTKTCSLPTDGDLVKIPGASNGGWAMSPDQQCTAGSYCPYACPPGKLMAQWDSSATSYSYPESQNGGLKCNDDGTVSKPFSNKPYCVDGEGTVLVKNSADSDVAFCQTVLPGDESMLIPTTIGNGNSETIAVPGPSYWASTSAHYYINPPGVSAKDGCVWGSKDKSQGNWTPYVAGANVDNNGDTFIKIGWNPKYIDDFNNQKPTFGIRINCSSGDCNGSNCEIDPSKTGFNGVSGDTSGKQEGASYCVITAKDQKSANIEVFSV